MWLDDYTAGRTEVMSRLVATEVACGNRDDCFALTALRLVVAPSRGRRLAFFEAVAACVHALVDGLGRRGSSRTDENVADLMTSSGGSPG